MTAKGTAIVINLARFGDLLQCQPLLEELHELGSRVHLVCLENFSGAFPLLRHVERVWPLPGARLMADMDRDWRVAAARLLQFARDIRDTVQPQQVINLSTTLPARLLSRLFNVAKAHTLGFCLDPDGFGRNHGIWASFLNGATANRLSSPFNLVDIFRMIGNPHGRPHAAHVPRLRLASPSAPALARARSLLAEAPQGVQGYVGMQLGASDRRRQWPTGSFAAVGERLWREMRLCPILLGSTSETALADAYRHVSSAPCVNAIGKTDLETLAALVQYSRLLITNDTGTMHLAAGLEVPCLALFLATAQPCDTGPYLPDCCCLEPALPCHPCPYNSPCPNDLACLRRISPSSVGDLVVSRLGQGQWETARLAAIENEARVWITAQDAQGFALVRRLSLQPPDDRTLWLGQQRIFWRQLLDDMAAPDQPIASGQKDPKGFTASAYSTDFVQRLTVALDQALALLAMLTEQCQLVGKSARAGQLLLRNCQRLQTVLDACTELRSLGGFWRELRQERGAHMDDFQELTVILHRHLAQWREFFTLGT